MKHRSARPTLSPAIRVVPQTRLAVSLATFESSRDVAAQIGVSIRLERVRVETPD